MSDCLFAACGRLAATQGYCRPHDLQRRRGQELRPVRTRHSRGEKRGFWPNVHKAESCWNWTGHLNVAGYGILTVGGVMRLAHRQSWSIHRADSIKDKFLDHRCGNRKCVNPDHLRIVTPKQNSENRLGPRIDGSSGYLGVSLVKDGGKFRARVGHNGKRYQAGYFDTAEEAGEAARLLRNRLYTHNDRDRN